MDKAIDADCSERQSIFGATIVLGDGKISTLCRAHRLIEGLFRNMQTCHVLPPRRSILNLLVLSKCPGGLAAESKHHGAYLVALRGTPRHNTCYLFQPFTPQPRSTQFRQYCHPPNVTMALVLNRCTIYVPNAWFWRHDIFFNVCNPMHRRLHALNRVVILPQTINSYGLWILLLRYIDTK